MAQITLDLDRWPVPVVAPEGVIPDAELSAFFREYTAMLRKHSGQFVLIVDLRRAADMPPKQRKTLTDFIQQREASLAISCVGTALIFNSSLMRAILTGVLWVKRPPQEVRVFTSLQEADEWAHSALGQKRSTG